MKTLFEEKQRYTQWWLWLIIVVNAVIVIAIFSHALYKQLVLGEPWGDKPLSDDELVGISLFVISAMVLMLLVFFNSVLEVVVDKASISYRYIPLLRKWRRIERENIQRYEIKKYYLRGYGVKFDFRGNRTINVKGHIGIEFTLGNGHRLLLGTQKPEEFLLALNKMKNRRED
jgi:hypothetical protein